MNIEIGTKVVGNWGAMHPTSEGEVVFVLSDDVGVKWEDSDDIETVEKESIHEKGWTSRNGSGIGIFIK
jgi:hypothetical protein